MYGVPSKNLRRLNGKPLFKYIVDVAKQSEAFDDIYIDTDSERNQRVLCQK